MIEITYIWHDCFVVRTEGANYLFDYWRDSTGRTDSAPAFLSMLERDKPLVVLVTHFHKDHYNPAIFAWVNEFVDVQYVVSVDVWKRMRHIVSPTSVYAGPKVEPSLVHVLKPGADAAFPWGKVVAFPSTDVGNSYLVETEGMRIFHAGDLNAWVWRDESTPQEIAKALGDFEACIRDIRAWFRTNHPDEKDDPRIDYCFFPVDARIGSGYYEGAKTFLQKFDVGTFFPMHFALGNADEKRAFLEAALRMDLYANPERGVYVPLAIPGASFLCCDKPCDKP